MVDVDRVEHDVHREPGKLLSRIVGDGLRDRDCAAGRPTDRSHCLRHERALPEKVPDMPDDRHSRECRGRQQQVGLHAVRVHQVRIERSDLRQDPVQIAGDGRRRDAQLRSDSSKRAEARATDRTAVAQARKSIGDRDDECTGPERSGLLRQRAVREEQQADLDGRLSCAEGCDEVEQAALGTPEDTRRIDEQDAHQ